MSISRAEEHYARHRPAGASSAALFVRPGWPDEQVGNPTGRRRAEGCSMLRIFRLSSSPLFSRPRPERAAHIQPSVLPLTPMDRIRFQHLIALNGPTRSKPAGATATTTPTVRGDGVFVGMNQGATGRSYRGRDTLASLARGGSRNPNYVSHYITNVVLEATPDGAKGTEYAIIGDFGVNGSTDGKWTHGGRYQDTYVKTPDGWRFRRVCLASEGGRPEAVADDS